MRVYLDIYLAHNLGDDLFLKIIAEKFPNVEFVVNYYGGFYSQEFSKYENIIFPQYPMIYRVANRLKVYDYISDVKRICRDTDGCIFLGGSIFREETYWKPLYEWRMQLVNRFTSQNKPVFVIGANFGPVQSKEFIYSYQMFFKKCSDVCFRDSYSASVFSNIKQVRFEKDIVFQLPMMEYISLDRAISISVIDPDHIPSLQGWSSNYIEWLSNGAVKMILKGYEVRLLSFCEGEGDLSICKSVRDKVELMLGQSTTKIKIVSYNDNMSEVLENISSSELVIASRFHANILALKLKKKLLPLIYSEKTVNVLKEVHFKGKIVPIEKIVECDMNILAMECISESHWDYYNQKVAESAEHQFDLFSEYVNKHEKETVICN